MGARLAGRRALVTGAASGIGRGIALGFIEQGAAVALVDRNADGLAATAQLAAESAGRWHCIATDVTDATAVAAAVQRADDEFGGLDILVNCVGAYLRGKGDGPVDELEPAMWQHVFAINASSVFHTAKYAVPVMQRSGGGSIINVSSMGGVVSSSCHAYSAAKGAVNSLTRSLAFSYAKDGIRANVIAPGVVETPMSVSVTQDPVLAEQFRSSVPLGRFARVDDIVPLAIYLASDESSYITGVTFPVEGGRSVRSG